MKPWILILTGVCIGLVAGAVIYLLIAPPRGNPVALLPESTPAPVTVHIDGEVSQPGVYQLPPGSRVRDGIEKAGGFTPLADTTSINQAARLSDGQKISIPAVHAGAVSSPGRQTGAIPLETASPGRLNLNLATVEQLDGLPGIGAGKASSIVAYRQKNGPFKTIEDIMNVPGIGEGIFESIKEFIFVDGS